MISLAPTRARTAALLATALAATTVVVAAPDAHAADSTPPTLSAVGIVGSKDVRPGDALKLSYSANDDSGAVSIWVRYFDSQSRDSFWSVGENLPLSGEATLEVPGGHPDGRMRVNEVWVVDASHNAARYVVGGDVCADACQPGGHAMDLPAALDLTMSDSEADVAVPTVTSLTVDTATAAVGQVAQMRYTATEQHPVGVLPVLRGRVNLVSADNTVLTLHPSFSHDGTLRAVVPDTAPNGVYTVQDLYVEDALGNGATYARYGLVTRHPTSATGPGHHSLPFVDLTITVTGSSVDVLPPTFTSVSYPSGFLTTGTTSSVGFSAADDLSGVAKLEVEFAPVDNYMSPDSWTLTVTPSGTTTGTGPTPAVTVGPWRVMSVKLTDRAGNWSRYASDGYLWCNRNCRSSHSIDFGPFAAQVVARPDAPESLSVVPGNGGAQVSWQAPWHDGGRPVTGYTVMVSPGGKTYSTTASNRAVSIGGLTNNVRYTYSVRARNAAGTGSAATQAAYPRGYQRFTGLSDRVWNTKPYVIPVNRYNSAFIYRGTGTGALLPGAKTNAGMANNRIVVGGQWAGEGNWTGSVYAVTFDGRLRSYDPVVNNYNTLALHHDNLGTDYARYRLVVAPGDVTGDRLPDILGITDGGDLHLRRGEPDTIGSAKRINGGWNAFTSVVGVGDLNGDRRNDLVARKKDGTLWLYAGNGRGGFYAKQIGSSTSWKYFAHIAGIGDFTGDKRNDLLALTKSGYLYVYKGNGKGGFSSKTLVSKGFSSFV